MKIIEKRQNDISIFKLDGRLYSCTSPSFEGKILDAIKKWVTSVDLFLEAGRAQIREMTQAQEDSLHVPNG